MPPKPKRKRATFNPTVTVEATPDTNDDAIPVDKQMDKPAVRQVVEVVEETEVPEAIETIKKDAQEIEEVVENLEDAVDAMPTEDVAPKTYHEEVSEQKKEAEKSKDVVESLFTAHTSDVRPEITVVGKKDKSLAVWVGAMLGIAVAVGVGLVFLIKGPSGMPSIGAKPTPTSAPTVAPTPTIAVVIERKDISVRVLNGGGVVGAASKMKTFLEDKGYTVVSTGNTEEYTYDSTVVQAKIDKESYKTMVSDDLKADYSLEASTEDVPADATYDVIVIVGKE